MTLPLDWAGFLSLLTGALLAGSAAAALAAAVRPE